MRRRKADPHRADRHYYDCPHCNKGKASFLGRDPRGRRVFECDSCERKFGEYALEREAYYRFLRD